MIQNMFEKDLKLVRKFGKEKINGKSFDEYLTGEEEYFKIIEYLMATMLPWKKNYHPNQIREKAVFLYRGFKSLLRKKEFQLPPKKGTIFFLPISETNIIFFDSLIKSLMKKEKVKVLRYDYSLNGLKKQLEKKRVPYVNFERYLEKKTIRKIKKLNKKYKRVLVFAKKILKKNKQYERLKPTINYFFGARKRFYEILEFIEGLKNFIDKEKPSIIVLPGEIMDIHRATSYICKKKKIPCISLQEGHASKDSIETGETFALKKIVFGKIAKEILIEKGMPKNKIEVTGSPLYDLFAKKKLFGKEKIKKKLRMENKKIILFASTTNLDIAKKRLKILFEIAQKNPELRIIIKQHPGEYLDSKYEKFYKNLAKEYGISITISKGDMWKMLILSDIFITALSTTILEALLLKKPIILTNFEKLFGYDTYPEFKGVIWHAYNSRDIKKAVDYILKNKPGKKEENFRKKMIKDHLYKPDGRATERITKLINKLKLKN